MYELEDVRDIRSFEMLWSKGMTLITFNDGMQYCSCCGPGAVDYHASCDETATINPPVSRGED